MLYWDLPDGKVVWADDVIQTLRRHCKEGVKEFRFIGFHSQGEALCMLHNHTGDDTEIWVASPDGIDAENPIDVIDKMRFVARAGSVGGYHQFTEADFISHTLADGLWQDQLVLAESLLSRHPAYPALSFIPTIDWGYAAELVGLILDPRYYVAVTDSPLNERWSKLRKFLHIGGVSLQRRLKSRVFEVVMMAWLGDYDPSADGSVAGDFLRRQYAANLDRGKDRARTIVAETFVNFVRQVWLDGLSPTHRLFYPAEFFKFDSNKGTDLAFQEHCSSISPDIGRSGS